MIFSRIRKFRVIGVIPAPDSGAITTPCIKCWFRSSESEPNCHCFFSIIATMFYINLTFPGAIVLDSQNRQIESTKWEKKLVVCTAPGRDSGRFVPLKKRKMEKSDSDQESTSYRNDADRSYLLTNGLIDCVPKKYRFNTEFLCLMNTHLKNVLVSTAETFGHFKKLGQSDERLINLNFENVEKSNECEDAQPIGVKTEFLEN